MGTSPAHHEPDDGRPTAEASGALLAKDLECILIASGTPLDVCVRAEGCPTPFHGRGQHHGDCSMQALDLGGREAVCAPLGMNPRPVEGFVHVDIAQARDQPLIVVTHGVVTRILRGLYAGLPRAAAMRLPVPQDRIFRLAQGTIEEIAV